MTFGLALLLLGVIELCGIAALGVVAFRRANDVAGFWRE